MLWIKPLKTLINIFAKPIPYAAMKPENRSTSQFLERTMICCHITQVLSDCSYGIVNDFNITFCSQKRSILTHRIFHNAPIDYVTCSLMYNKKNKIIHVKLLRGTCPHFKRETSSMSSIKFGTYSKLATMHHKYS